MILFRKEAEKILQDHGFSKEFTVSRIDRHIWLVGKCGKQIIQISDLEVNNKLTKAERELLIEDYLYSNVIMKKAKIDMLISIQQDIEDINDKLTTIEKEDKVYIEKEYSYLKSKDIAYIVINIFDKNCKVTLKETLNTHEKYVFMNNVPQDKTCDIYNELIAKSPIRDKVFDLYNLKLKLEEDTLKLQRDLNLIC